MSNSSVYYTWEGLAVIFIPTIFLILPLSTFEKNTRDLDISYISAGKVKKLFWFLTIIGFYSILFFMQGLKNFFTIDIVDLRSGYGSLYEGGTFYSKVACMGAYLYPMSLFLYFYNVIKKQIPQRYNILLLISSLSFIVYTLNVAGRDGIVLWSLTFAGFYFFFSSHLPQIDNKKIMRKLRLGVLFFIPLFIYITISRFDSSDTGSLGAVFSYSGQQLNVMSSDLDIANKTGKTVGRKRNQFEFFYRLSDMVSGESRSRENRMENMGEAFNLGYKANSFGTYVHSLYPIYMSLWEFIILVLMTFGIYRMCLRTKGRTISSRHLIGALSWYTILISGVFYFYYGTYIGNVFLLLSLLIILIL